MRKNVKSVRDKVPNLFQLFYLKQIVALPVFSLTNLLNEINIKFQLHFRDFRFADLPTLSNNYGISQL